MYLTYNNNQQKLSTHKLKYQIPYSLWDKYRLLNGKILILFLFTSFGIIVRTRLHASGQYDTKQVNKNGILILPCHYFVLFLEYDKAWYESKWQENISLKTDKFENKIQSWGEMSHQKQEQYWIRLLYRVIWLDKNATKWYIVSLHWYNFSSWLYHTDTLSQYIIKHFMSELRSFEIILISSFCIINKWIKMLFVNKILIFLPLFNILTNWKNIWASECCPWRWNFHGQYCRPSLHTDLVEFC